jgi:hypothetical protein
MADELGLADIGNIAGAGIGAIGSLIGGNMSSSGYKKEAELYNQAAQLTDVEGAYTNESTQVQQILQQRKATLTLGAQQAAVGAHGFTEGGSNLYLSRDSMEQAHIANAMIGIQGAINLADLQEKKFAYEAQGEAATAAAKAASTGGILGALGGVAKIAGMIAPFL